MLVTTNMSHEKRSRTPGHPDARPCFDHPQGVEFHPPKDSIPDHTGHLPGLPSNPAHGR